MDLQIRLAIEEDIPEVLKLQELSLRGLCKEHYTPEQIDYLVKSQANARLISSKTNGELIYVAFSAGKIVGSAALLVGSARIGGLYVHPEFARQGIAMQLLSQLEKAAIRYRYRVLRVMSSLSAVAVYESAGYTQVRASRFKVANEQIRCVVLKKMLIPKDLRQQKMEKVCLFTAIFIVAVAVVITIL